MVGTVGLKFIYHFSRTYVCECIPILYDIDYWFKSFNRIFPTRQIQLFTITYEIVSTTLIMDNINIGPQEIGVSILIFQLNY